MTKTMVGILAFGTGCTVGYFTAKKLLEQKYEQLVMEEVEAVKEKLRKYRKETSDDSEATYIPTEEEKKEYAQKVQDLGYAAADEDIPFDVPPHVISPEDFGTIDEYDQISLTYYSDGVLADDDNRAMSDEEIEYAVGKESLTHFGEFEEDSVFVRNDRLKVDYEILLDGAKYSDILKQQPHLAH